MEDKDVKTKGEELLDDSSFIEESEDTDTKADKGGNADGAERTVPLAVLKEERLKRQELERRLNDMESKLTTRSTSDGGSDPELEAAIDKLAPLLRKRGYLTKEDMQVEEQSKKYASEMERLTTQINGDDGRPPFDAYEVSEYGKRNNIYDLETAYEKMHRKELLDWEFKRREGGTEKEDNLKPVNSASKQTGRPLQLTREMLAEKLRTREGRDWYNKNHEKIIRAMQEGRIV